MKQRRTIYFLIHALLVAGGTCVSLLGYGRDDPEQTVLVAIGTSIIATGAAGMLIWVYLSKVETSSERLELFSRAGLDWVYTRRAAQIRDEYASRLQGASDQIDIIGFGLTDFRRDYLDQLGALSARAQIRVLLLDPRGPYADQRDKEEGQSQGTIAREIDEFVSQFKARYPNENARLRVRYYTCLPLLNIFRIDDDVFYGPYLAGKASGNTFTFRSTRGSLFDQLMQHFEEVWKCHSRDI